jgi:Alkylmercury lyase
MSAELDRDVRLALFDLFVELGRAPGREEIAARASVTVEEVRASYGRLHDQRVIVLDPNSREVWMANPFSAVPTPFLVRIGKRSWYGNCIWDGLGICAMLGGEGTVDAQCPDCGEPLSVVVGQARAHGDGVAHFVVPAAHFWDDTGFT